MEGHTIICGLGRMGTMLARQLGERHVPMVIIEKDPEQCRLAEELRLLYIVGDATDEEMLRKAGIERAKNLVAALKSDAENVFTTLTAREMQPELFIVARAEQFSAEPKLRRAGANRVISPQAIGAERIVLARLEPRAELVDLLDTAQRVVGIDHVLERFGDSRLVERHRPPVVTHERAAVHTQRRSGDVAGLLTSQTGHDRGDLTRLAVTVHRNHPECLLESLGIDVAEHLGGAPPDQSMCCHAQTIASVSTSIVRCISRW